jgi:hypothetical protein
MLFIQVYRHKIEKTERQGMQTSPEQLGAWWMTGKPPGFSLVCWPT